MNNDKIVLTAEELYEHEFKIDARGYRPQEVDKILDLVIHDYKEFNNLLKEYAKENRLLNENIAKYKQEIRRLKTMLETTEENNSNNINNVDMLRRLSNLEKVVFGKNE